MSLLDRLRVIARSPRADRDKVRALLRLYRALDREVARFQEWSGLTCRAGCGRCCENPEIEATPLEVLPLAIELSRRGEAEATLDAARSQDHRGRCIFYHQDAQTPWRGRCANYAWRPLICRAFGHSALRTADGDRQILTCATIKGDHDERFAPAAAAVLGGAAIPELPAMAVAVTAIDPALGVRRLPINEAVGIALERVLLLERLAAR